MSQRAESFRVSQYICHGICQYLGPVPGLLRLADQVLPDLDTYMRQADTFGVEINGEVVRVTT